MNIASSQPPTFSPPTNATPSQPGSSWLEATFKPANNAAGHVYQVIQRDTGRVITELPFVVDDPAGSNVDLRA